MLLLFGMKLGRRYNNTVVLFAIGNEQGLAHQWIYVVTYSLELRDFFATSGCKNGHPTVQDEINSLVQRCEIFYDRVSLANKSEMMAQIENSF